MNWTSVLHGDPLPWLLDDATPAVKYLALCDLLDRPKDDPSAVAAQAAAMQADPIATILAAQHPDGYWVKPGAGYAPKYTGTVWQLMFLDQMGANGRDPRIRAACDYVLAHAQATNGGFGASGIKDEAAVPPPSRAIHCLTGNLLRALIGFGYLDDARVQRAIDWQAGVVTGEGDVPYYASGVSGPGFCCGANDKRPCAWGAIKVMLAFARIPTGRRTPAMERAVEQGLAFLLSCDPATAMYPIAYGNTKPSGSWFKLGFPSGYVADVLQNLEALCELGHARDPRLGPAIQWLLAKQDGDGRWSNEYAYPRKTWVDVDRQGRPSTWVTLRACRVLKAALG